jgi:predicted DNA-binding transcriptional regulator YafY
MRNVSFLIASNLRAMSETSGRILTLLSLLQTPREWPGPELADRLGVTTRTVRNDVERLRSLGYPVEATRGPVGGYKLVAGTAMPPLLLEDEEAVAVAVSLRTASGGAVSGMEESALRALTKLQQVLPKRLGQRVDALQSHTARVAPYTQGPRMERSVDGSLLTLIANAARDRELVRFDYSDRSGQGSERKVEPYRLVNWGRRWYLVAFDPQRDDWRTFRVDRLKDTRSTGHRFKLRDLPADDVAAWVASKIRAVQQQVYGKVRVRLPATDVVARLGPWLQGGGVEPLGDDECLVTMGARTHGDLAFWIGILDADFEVVDSPELAEAVGRTAARYARAAG